MSPKEILPILTIILSVGALSGVAATWATRPEQTAPPLDLDARFQQLGIHNMCIDMDGADVVGMTRKKGDGTCPHDFNWRATDKNVRSGNVI